MNCKKFLDYFIKEDKLHIIQNGFQYSCFNPENIKIYDIIRTIIDSYDYQNLKCQQNGIPTDKKMKEKQKKSYCTNFDVVINNLLGIYGFEISKYILFRLNFKQVLNKFIDLIENTANDFNSLENYLIKFIEFYSKMNIKFSNFEEFNNEYSQTMFGKLHTNSNIQEIFNEMKKDIHKENSNITSLIEIKSAILEILKLIVKYLQASTLTINTIDDLIIDLKIDIDIGYDGSFLKLVHKLYEEGSCTDEILIQYNLKQKIHPILHLMEQWMHNLIEKIINLYPTVKFKINDGLITYLSHIILDWFIVCSINIAIILNVNKNFEKTSRIHFKTIYNAIIMSLPKYTSYTKSQLTLIHYALLTRQNIQKALKIVNTMSLSDEKIKGSKNGNKGNKSGNQSDEEIEEQINEKQKKKHKRKTKKNN